jgi:hypothetical protein
MAAAVHTWFAIVIGPLILTFLGFLLFKLISELLRLSRDHEFPAFESNWGGLGRGLGGWSINRMMVIGVLTLLVLLMFGSVSFELLLTNASSPINRTEADNKRGCSVGENPKPAVAPAAHSDSIKAADAAQGTGKSLQSSGKE